MTDSTPYTVPKEPGRWRAIAFAALVHVALLAFLWIGIRWQNETPVAVEAEVWDMQPREAAPLPPQPAREPEPQPVVEEAPQAPVVEPPAVKPPPKVDIALEQEKKRKALEEKRRAEEERQQAELKKRREEEEKRQAELKEKKRREAEQLALQKQKQKEAEEKRLEKEKAEKAAAEKKRKQEEAEKQLLAKMREEEMRRMAGAVAGTGGAGDAARSQGSRGDPSYAQRVAAKIKSNISYNVPDGMQGNPAVEYVVNLLPDGSVAGIRKVKSSGIPGFDEAVARAIEKSQPYPKDKNGTVPPSFTGIHKPKDQ